jgi:hypothetical protein
MKMKNFTLNALMASVVVIAGSMTLNAQDTGTGTGWGKLSPGEPMVLNENFRGFAHFHSDAQPNEGNSNNLDVDGVVVYGYTNLEHSVKYIGSEHKANYSFYQCAFAPNWDTAYGYRDSVAGTSTTATTPSVSRGFVEISRTFGASGGALPTVHGHFIVDLRNLEMVEVIQYTHSSTGGNRRGFLLEYSIDDSLTWDTLRFQPGNAWSTSFPRTSSLEKKQRIYLIVNPVHMAWFGKTEFILKTSCFVLAKPVDKPQESMTLKFMGPFLRA